MAAEHTTTTEQHHHHELLYVIRTSNIVVFFQWNLSFNAYRYSFFISLSGATGTDPADRRVAKNSPTDFFGIVTTSQGS